MPIEHLNGIKIYSESHGTSGPHIILVHGSRGDHHSWDAVIPQLARIGHVTTYDRRGHSQSERPAGKGNIHDDVADLAALIERHRLFPAHVVGNSFGAIVALNLIIERSDLIASAAVHEPPLIGLLDDNAVDIESLVDEVDDRMASTIDLARLSSFGGPLMMSRGTASPPFLDAIMDIIADAVPRAQRYTFRGAGQLPQVTHPDDYAMVIGAYISGVTGASS